MDDLQTDLEFCRELLTKSEMLKITLLYNDFNVDLMNKSEFNIETIGTRLKWGQTSQMLIYLLSFGANPFDTFQVSHKFCGQRGAKLYHIRMNLISFIRNRNVNFLNFVIEKGLNLYYQKFIDHIVHLIDVKYNLGTGNDIVQLCNVIVKNYLFGTIEERYWQTKI